MNWILKIKHWQTFLLLLPFMIAAATEFGEGLQHLYWISLIGISVVFIWQFILTTELIQIIPKKINLNINLFYFNYILFLSVYIVVVTLNDGNDFHYDGIYALIGFYIFYAFL